MSQNLHPQLAQQMGQLLYRLAGDPKTRGKVLPLIQEAMPGYRLPADVAVEQLEKRLKAEKEEEQKAARKLASERKSSAARAKLIDEGGYDEDTVKKIEETVMKKYPSLEYADAAKIYASEDGPAAHDRGSKGPDGMFGQNYEFPMIPGLLENETKAARDMAKYVIDELRGR